jgi:hypothetical protein
VLRLGDGSLGITATAGDGDLTLQTEDDTGNTRDAYLQTGASSSGTTGWIYIRTKDAALNSGGIELRTGDAGGSSAAGPIRRIGGDSVTGNGAYIEDVAGNGGTGGQLFRTAGNGIATDSDAGYIREQDQSRRIGVNAYHKTDGDNTFTLRSDTIELLVMRTGATYQIVDVDDDTVTADDTDYLKASKSIGNWKVHLTSAGALTLSLQRDASTDRQARVMLYRNEHLTIPTS